MRDVNRQIDKIVKDWYTRSARGVLRTILVNFPQKMKYGKHQLEIGDYIPGVQGEGFTAAHWFLPEELRELFEQRGVDVLEMAGLEGLSSHQEKETNRLYKDQESGGCGLTYCLAPARTHQSWEVPNTSSSSARNKVRLHRCRV